MYYLMGEMWPKKDPMTGREVCHACWNRLHKKCGEVFDENKRLKCDHFYGRRAGKCDCNFECDCIHLSEAQFAAEQRAKVNAARKAIRNEQIRERDDPANPLRAIVVEKPKKSKRPVA